MTVSAFPCPHCSIPLRMKDRGLVGQTIVCPDCRAPIQLRNHPDGGIIGEAKAFPDAREAGTEGGSRGSIWGDFPVLMSRLATPVGVAWFVAACLTLGAIAWLTASPIRSANSASESDVAIAELQSSVGEPGLAEDGPVHPVDVAPVRRLHGLHDKFKLFQSETGAWPAGTAGDGSLPEDGRFSWLALLASRQHPAGIQPRWDHRWDAPENDRFVRRRQDPYLNVAIPQQTGDDGYPTSHFAGVTGVGPDSASLPPGHPRAGVFGTHRVTTLGEVPDGLGNTMLAAGVERELGSWAAAGHSTIRGFTSEPYVRGPDGFGTGQADGMFVLMADGSTRFLSAETDPAVLRSLAATSDVVSSHRAAAGEPEKTEVTQQELPDDNIPVLQEVEDIVADLAEPLDEPVVEDQQLIDIGVAVAQPIIRFEQKSPVAARELLLILEEMSGVRIESSKLPETVRTRLQQPVSLDVQNATVGDVLSKVLTQIHLSYVVRVDHLELTDVSD